MFVNSPAPKIYQKNEAFLLDKYQSDKYNIDIGKYEVRKWTRMRA